MKKITKAVFPVAGMGSRFLPATKASPKEMMPVVDKPLIQYAVEEAVAAGITDMVFITGHNKRAIEDHFDMAYEVEAELAAHGKYELLRAVHDVIPCCAHNRSCRMNLSLSFSQMIDVFASHQCSVLGVQEVPREQTGQYGIISTTNLAPRLELVHGLVENLALRMHTPPWQLSGAISLRPEFFIIWRNYRQVLMAKFSSLTASLRCCRKKSYWPIVSAAPAMIAVQNWDISRFRLPLD